MSPPAVAAGRPHDSPGPAECRGDRKADAALRDRARSSPVGPLTRDYCERRAAEGKTRRHIVRCLKRHVACEFFHLVRPEITLREVVLT